METLYSEMCKTKQKKDKISKFDNNSAFKDILKAHSRPLTCVLETLKDWFCLTSLWNTWTVSEKLICARVCDDSAPAAWSLSRESSLHLTLPTVNMSVTVTLHYESSEDHLIASTNKKQTNRQTHQPLKSTKFLIPHRMYEVKPHTSEGENNIFFSGGT